MAVISGMFTELALGAAEKGVGMAMEAVTNPQAFTQRMTDPFGLTK